MRISDWSSDVCSSDLGRKVVSGQRGRQGELATRQLHAVAAVARKTHHHRFDIRRAALACFFNRLGQSRHGHPGDSLVCIPYAFGARSEEHTSELQSLMRISYAVFCLKKKTKYKIHTYE